MPLPRRTLHLVSRAFSNALRTRAATLLFLVVFAFSIVSAPFAHAQTVLTGLLHGPGGRVVPNAVVVVINEATGQRWSTTSSPDGVYQFVRLPPGAYEVSVELEGFAPFRASSITISSQLRTPFDIELVLATNETVNIQGRAGETSIQFGASDRPARFTSQDLATLPLASGRTLQSIEQLVPGLLYTDSTGTLAQFTALGQRRFANRLFIDGVSADLAVDVRGVGIGEAASGALPATAASGGLQTIVPWDSIEEIQIYTTATTAEHARTPGAQTVIVTRAGTDRFSGSAFASLRPQSLAASDWFSNAALSPRRGMSLWNAGGSTGGPIRRGRLNYLLNWEGQSSNRPVTTTIKVPSIAARKAAPPAIRSLLEAFPEPNGVELEDYLAEYSNQFPVRARLWTLSARTDLHISPRHRAFVRVNHGDSLGDALGAAPYQNPFLSYTNRESTSTTTATAGWTWILGNSGTSDFRINRSLNLGASSASAAEHGNARALSVEAFQPALAPDSWVAISLFPGPSGVVASGRFGASLQCQFGFSERVSVVRGRHQWRFGFDYSRNVTAVDASPSRYTFRVAGVPTVLQGRPVIATVTSQMPENGFLRQSWSAFFQDGFRLSTRLTLEYGARYSVQPAPVSLSRTQPLLLDFEALPDLRIAKTGRPLWRTSWTRVAPRMGAAYQLAETSDGASSVLRANWGLTSDELTSPGGAAFGRGYPYFTGRTGIAPRFPELPSALIDGVAPDPLSSDGVSDYFAFPKDLRSPRSTEWQVAWDHELGGQQRLSVSYVRARGRDLIYWQGYSAGGARAAVNAYSNDGSSDYRALLLQYDKRLSHGWRARLSYSGSRALDVDSGESIAPNPPARWVLPASRGPSDFDRPHALRILASWQTPRPRRLPNWSQAIAGGWSIDVSATLMSGAPFSVTSDRSLGGATYKLRVDMVPGAVVWLEDRSAPGKRRLNPSAFVIPSAERQGTTARNAIRSGPLQQVDVVLARPFRLGARTSGQFRVEVFNVFNRPNFGAPETDRSNPNFGRSFQTQADAMGTGTLARGGLAPIHQLGGPRSFQVGIRWGF